MKKIFFLVLFVFAFASLVYAAEQSRIELTNGNTLEGEIVSFSEGKYTVRNPDLGTFKVEGSQVRAIHKTDEVVGAPKKNTALPDAVADPNEIQKIRSAIAGNPDVMKDIPGLLASPDFQALLKDPEIMKAANAMDIKALMANEKVVKATDNPTLKKIGQQIEEKNN